MSEINEETKINKDIKIVDSSKEYKINQLKIEIFDIIQKQEQINNEFNSLQQIKLNKLQELQKLEH